MTGAVAVDMVAGLAIRGVIPRPHGAAGRSVAGLAATIATRMTVDAGICPRGTMKADSPARGLVTMTMKMTGGAAAGMAAGTAIPRVTPRHRVAAGKSVKAPARGIATMTTIAAVICPRGMMKAGSRARGHATMTTMTTGAAAADTAAGTAIRKAIPRRHAAVAGNPLVNLSTRPPGTAWRPFCICPHSYSSPNGNKFHSPVFYWHELLFLKATAP
jgi:hypothetical protein